MSFRAPINQFNQAHPISEDQLRRFAPSIFATEAHDSRSDRFTAVPTIEVVRALGAEGFLPFRAAQSVCRDASKRDFTKHMVRFRKVDRTDLVVGDNILEVVLVNGNDGSSAYKLDAGVFRIACLNGMVVKSKDYGSVKVRHSGDILGKVIEGTYEVVKNADRVIGAVGEWSNIELSDRARRAFAVGAHVERFADAHGVINTPITPDQLLQPRRYADAGNSLWQTFNVIQENVIRGNLHATGVNANGHRRQVTTRGINGIDQDVKLNKGLWAMAEYLAENA